MTPIHFRSTPRLAASLAALSLAALLSACGGGGGGSDSTGGTASSGTLRVAMTDAPSCGFDEVNVTVQKVRVHQSSSASDTDAGWSEVTLSPAKRVDLLSLTNGVLSELGQTSLPTGRYTQMRLVLAANDTATPLANSVKPTGGVETALTVPSGVQTGIKLNVDTEVKADQVADVVLDFDACRSVVKLGASGRYNLSPVVSVLPRVSDAANRVIGYVTPALAVGSTLVSAQVNGVPVKSTVPDSTGKFTLAPLAAGNYDVVVSAAGRATAAISGVPVSTTTNTTLNASTAPIDPPAATVRNVSGNVAVTPVASPITATVVARKVFADGLTVEVAGMPVDGSTGAFSLDLPASAPQRANYVVGAALSFTADATTPTGKYNLVATSGTLTKTAPVDISTAATAIDIALP